MQSLRALFATILVGASATAVAAGDGHHHHHHGHGAETHAPIGVMGDHAHGKNEWMMSYRYMSMSMSGLADGSNGLTNQEVFDRGYMVAPQDMTMDMHMFGAMYAPSNSLTLMAMLPYVEKDMDLLRRAMPMNMGMGMGDMGMGMGGMMMPALEFSTKSSGFGDLKLSGIYKLKESSSADSDTNVLLNFGVSLPTGAINEKDQTPMGNTLLPYPMQLGSGTVDLLPGITYNNTGKAFNWGAQARAVIRLGDNYRGYSLGNRYEASAWIAKGWAPEVSTSLRLKAQKWGDVDGADDGLNPNMIPTADPDNLGGERVELIAGINLMATSGAVKGNRLALEIGAPVHQDLDGPQMETDWTLTLGWQLAF